MVSWKRSVVAFAIAVITAAQTFAVDGVKGTLVQPALVKAKVGGCKIARPGKIKVKVGNVIQLDYTYPIVPAAIPKKVDYKSTLGGAVTKSKLGFRSINNTLVGAGGVAFFFDAAKEGKETITLIIDDNEYKYEFEVSK